MPQPSGTLGGKVGLDLIMLMVQAPIVRLNVRGMRFLDTVKRISAKVYGKIPTHQTKSTFCFSTFWIFQFPFFSGYINIGFFLNE